MQAFQPIDAALLRATAWPPLVIPEPWPDVRDPDQALEWLAQAWTAPVAEAVWLASPALADRIGAMPAGQGRRLVLPLARYLLRAGRRATPFAEFAGVAPLRFAQTASVHSTGLPLARVRADAEWLAAVITRLEAEPDLLHRLPVQSNNLAAVRGNRLVVARLPHASKPQAGPVRESSVENTTAVQLAVRAAAVPVPAGDLAATVATAYPDSPPDSAAKLIGELVRQGVLITALRPPSTSTDPLGYLLRHLDAAGTDADLVELVAELHAVHADLCALGGSDSRPGGPAGRAAAGRMRAMAAVEQPLVVDLRLGDHVVLPEQVAAEAAMAAEVLRRLSPYPGGRPDWQAYLSTFVARYGTGTLVPLAELVDPVAGLGYPAHLHAAPDAPRAVLSARDERLLTLAQQALLDGVRHVVLNDASVDALAGDAPGRSRAAAHLDLCAEVRSPSMEALNAGRFTLAVTGMGRSAPATSGRFLDLLAEADRSRMTAEFSRLPVAVDGALAVQLSFPPHRTRPENVLRAVQVLPAVLGLAEHREPSPGKIDLDDLAVTADDGRLVLVSVSRRQVVELALAHAAAPHTMPLLARFLLELPRATATGMKPFDWGAARELPFRPAVSYGRVLLCAARWRIDPARLPGADAPEAAWAAAWTVLRSRLRLPVLVQVGNGDRRLRLNLNRAMDLALLRAHLDSVEGPVTVVEAASPADFGWIGGRAHEIVVPLASNAPPEPAPAVLSGPWPAPGQAQPVLPGGRLVSAKLFTDPQLLDLIVSRGVPALLAEWNEPPALWFLRMLHPVPHLRIRVHTTDYGSTAARIGQWATNLHEQGLVGDFLLDTYLPETGRYGEGPCLAAAEALFAADSTAVLAQLALAAGSGPHLHAVTAASLVDLAGAMLTGPAAGHEWLIARPELTGSEPVDRAVLRQALALDHAALDRSGAGRALLDAWERRRDAAGRYAAALAAAGSRLSASGVLGSLLHLHYVRAEGPDPAAEAYAYRLARNLALAVARRRTPRGTAR
ncbi:lantibiotic dehydratase [Longispora sp. NPDC051575]|uniref:lantibiotic dehydratase n=1 Tax=Longispora sp. NPDC051575 TaxID=3154943 RepID=UPI00343F4F60